MLLVQHKLTHHTHGRNVAQGQNLFILHDHLNLYETTQLTM